jgi:hypothetical protein
MAGIVLALAGLTCGDGGPGMGPAREPGTEPVKLGEGFKGYLRLAGGPACRAELRGGTLTLTRYDGDPAELYYCALTGDGEGRFRLRWFVTVYRGTVETGPAGAILTVRGPDQDSDDDLAVFLREITSPAQEP